MKIAYLTSRYPAPSHTFIRREVEALRRLGYDIDTYSIRRPAPTEIQSVADRQAFDSTIYVLPAGPLAIMRAIAGALFRSPIATGRALLLALRHRPPGFRAWAYAWIYFVESLILSAALRRSGAQHVHNHFANPAAIVGMLSARLLGLPFSLTLHGISEFDYPAGLMLRDKITRATFVACASWFVRAQAMRLAQTSSWPKLHVVRCGLDLAQFAFEDRPQPRGARLVCVGRLSAEKGHFGLFEAIEGLRDLAPELLLVGDGPLRETLEADVTRRSLTDRVKFLGALPEDATRSVIASGDLLILPSFMEGLPVVLMEAMALGVPVVAARVAGIPELVEDGAEGLLFTPSDWGDLQAKIRSVLSDGARTGGMRLPARRKIEREFGIELNAARIAALFEGHAPKIGADKDLEEAKGGNG